MTDAAGPLKGSAASTAVRRTLGRVLEAHGLVRGSGAAYAKTRPDGVLVLGHLARSAKSTYPGVASSVSLELGLGSAPDPRDMRTAAMRSLPFLIGSGALAERMCVLHNEIVEGWRSLGPEASRVAMLLGWTVRTDWRNAPEVLWFRTEADLVRWGELPAVALPVALARLETATLDRSQLSASLALPST